MPLRDTSFPTAQQLGIPETPAPAIEAARAIARKLIGAENPFVVTSTAGRNPATVPALVKLCELLAMPVASSGFKAYHCFPKRHPLYLGDYPLKEADVVVAIDAIVPWTPGPKAPPSTAYVAVIDIDPVRQRIPTYEFTADIRVTSDVLRATELLTQLVEEELTPAVRAKIEARRERCETFTSGRRAEWNAYAESKANADPIDPAYVTYELAKVIDDNCIVFDETLQTPMIDRYVPCNVPGSYFHNPASSGGWSIGAAFGAKLAAPDKDIIACTGDGFYQYSTATAALWAAVHFGAPFMAVVYQNRSYSTGTVNVGEIYPDGYAFKAGYEGGHFDPPVDFAKEAEAAGAHGENVRSPAEVRTGNKGPDAADRNPGRDGLVIEAFGFCAAFQTIASGVPKSTRTTAVPFTRPESVSHRWRTISDRVKTLRTCHSPRVRTSMRAFSDKRQIENSAKQSPYTLRGPARPRASAFLRSSTGVAERSSFSAGDVGSSSCDRAR